MKHFVFLAVFGAIAATSATSVHAQIPLKAAPAATAATQALEPNVQIFKNQLEGLLENQKAMSAANGCKFITTGNITVEKASGYYAFTLPKISYVSDRGSRSEIGMIAINAVPDADNVNWKLSLAIPTPIKRYDAKNTELVRTEFGAQNISGVWNTKLGRFTKLNGTLDNVRQNFLAEQTSINIGNITLASQFTEQDPGAWTGPVNVTLNNFSVFNAASKLKDSLPKITIKGNLANRAENEPLTKEQIIARSQSSYPDYYNLISLLLGAPDRLQVGLTGIDAMSKRLQGAMLTAPQEMRNDLLAINLLVTGISGVGRPSAIEPATKDYDVIFTGNGGATINGLDLGGMLPK